MKKFLSLALAICMTVSLCACGDSDAKSDDTYRVAMVTDYGDVSDQSYNQTTYEACKAFCESNKVDFSYFRPVGDSNAERVAMIEKAVDEGYNVIVMPGYAFGAAIVEAAGSYPDIKFIALDVAEGDILEAGVPAKGGTYDYNPDNWDVTEYYNADNVYCAIYQEELSGYMAGYAAVKLGYTKLGFLGGMAVPAVLRYGYGFVQGVDAASTELGITTEMKYAYGNQFFGDADITAAVDTWYQSGTEVVFSCGADIFTSAAEAAQKVNGKIIGVDIDQAANIDGNYGAGMTVTSAMKGLAPTVSDTLNDVINNGKWDSYKGKITTLGLISGDDPTLNYVQLPMDTTQWGDGFSQDDYKALVKSMFDGTIKVSNDINAEPATSAVSVEWLGNIK